MQSNELEGAAMDTFKPARSKITLRLFLFIAVIASPFIWATYAGARLLLNGGIEDMGSYKKVDLKALGYFNFDNMTGTIENVPARYRNLDGQKVALEGFMYLQNGAARLHHFEFVFNRQICCFRGPPLVQERVFVHSQVALPYVDGECRIVGTLHVRIEKNEVGTITSVYTMDVDKWQEI
jgi:hypothetical protein